MAPMGLFYFCCALSLSLTQASFDDASALLQKGAPEIVADLKAAVQVDNVLTRHAIPEEKASSNPHKNKIAELTEEIEQRKKNIARMKEEVAATKSREKWIKADKDEAERKAKAAEAAKAKPAAAAASLPAEQMLDVMYHRIADQPEHPTHTKPAALKVATETKQERIKRIMDSIGKEKDASESLRAGFDEVQKICPDCRLTPDEAYSLKPVAEVFKPTPDPNWAAKVRNQQITAQANAWQIQQQQQALAAQKAQADAKQAADARKAYAVAAEQQRQYKAKVEKVQSEEAERAAERAKQQRQVAEEKAKLDGELKAQWENMQRLQAKDRKKEEEEEKVLAEAYQSGDGD